MSKARFEPIRYLSNLDAEDQLAIRELAEGYDAAEVQANLAVNRETWHNIYAVAVDCVATEELPAVPAPKTA